MQQEAYLQKLDRLVQRLNEDPAAFKFDKKSLAQLVAGLQQFMEDALGINVSAAGRQKRLKRGAGALS